MKSDYTTPIDSDYWHRFNETEIQSIGDLDRFQSLLNTHSEEGLVGDISRVLQTIEALKEGQKHQVLMSHLMENRADGMEFMAAHLLNTVQIYRVIVDYLFENAR